MWSSDIGDWKMNIVFSLWKIYEISNIWASFIETNSYWGSYSQDQSILIFWLSKHLLQIASWLGEHQQIAVSHSPSRIHERFTLAVLSVWGESQVSHLTWELGLSSCTKLKLCVLSLFSSLQIVPPTWNDAGKAIRPSCRHQCYIQHANFCLSSA